MVDGELVFSPRGAWQLVGTSDFPPVLPATGVSRSRANQRKRSDIPNQAELTGHRSNVTTASNEERQRLLDALIDYITANPSETPI